MILGGDKEDSSSAQSTASPPSFGPAVRVNNNAANDQGAPSIARVPGQEPFVAWQDSRSGNQDLYATKSQDNGTSFEVDTRVDDSVGISAQIEPSVAVSSNGTIMLVWQDNRRTTFDYDIYFTKSNDGGKTFWPNVKVDDSNETISWQERPSIAVTDNGVIYVAWMDDRSGHIRIRGAFSTDNGMTFSSSKEIAPSDGTNAQSGVQLAVHGNKIFAAFIDNPSGITHPYLAYSIDGGTTFSSPLRLDNTDSSGASQRDIAIASLPDGGLAAIWGDTRSGNLDIYGCFVSASGVVGASNYRVDDDTSGAAQETPCLASDQNGNLYAAWEDERNSLFAIRFTYLQSGRTQYSASTPVAIPGGNDIQRRPSITAVTPGHVFVAWQDDKAGTDDVYSAAGTVPSLVVALPELTGILIPIVAIIAVVLISRRRLEH